jgi:cyanate permease
MITSLSSGFLMKYGKSKLLLFTNLVLVIGNCMSLIENIPLQLIGRFIWGMAAGVYTVLVPKFINETAPCELKGPFGGISQVMVTAGILMVAILALPIPYFTLNLAGQVVWLTDKGTNYTPNDPEYETVF